MGELACVAAQTVVLERWNNRLSFLLTWKTCLYVHDSKFGTFEMCLNSCTWKMCLSYDIHDSKFVAFEICRYAYNH